jgi:hypothetical protein
MIERCEIHPDGQHPDRLWLWLLLLSAVQPLRTHAIVAATRASVERQQIAAGPLNNSCKGRQVIQTLTEFKLIGFAASLTASVLAK